MSSLTNYIVRGAVAGLIGLAVGESMIVAVETIKIRKNYIKALKEDKDIPQEHVDKVKKSGKIWLDSIKAAAKKRVEDIKKDPGAEFAALWGCATYLIGNWKGFFRGYEKGWDYGGGDIDRLMEFFKDKYPIETTALVKRAIDDKASVVLSQWAHGDTWHRASWVAEACDLPKIKEVLA